ncbi:hypothetical protein JCM33374_g4173 [Metschnikowia sp. JCM 33374]|nr:hypothetical protein JCM33374_g4173 [Metschnikowia sp. JCM 33374]
MGQKRTKNQIRRERQKLRKLKDSGDNETSKNDPGSVQSEKINQSPPKVPSALGPENEVVQSTSSVEKKSPQNTSEEENPKAVDGEESTNNKDTCAVDTAPKPNCPTDKKILPVSETAQEKIVEEKQESSSLLETGPEEDNATERAGTDTDTSLAIPQPKTEDEAEAQAETSNGTEAKGKHKGVPPSKSTPEFSEKPSPVNPSPEKAPDKHSSNASITHKETSSGSQIPAGENSQSNYGEADEAEAHKAQLMDIFSKLKDTSSSKTSSSEEYPEEYPEEQQPTHLLSQYANVFEKFQQNPKPHQIVAYSDTHDFSSDTNTSEESDIEQDGSDKKMSKRQKRIREKVPISVLKASTHKPQAVEWYDADAPDPFMVVHLKTSMNHVDVPPHWQQKKEYLSSKRGVERPPFMLPKFIENTGIAEMRNHDPDSLKKSQRDRVQPKMGRLDIDYQKLHDAFFKYQTKPRLLAFGEVYSEGRENADQNRDVVAHMRPGKISKALRLAVGMSENETTMPPWITVMKEIGKPPSYSNLWIPGLDGDYTNSGYQVQYGEKGSALDLSGETWGSLEDGEESEADSEDSEDSESEDESVQPAAFDGPGSVSVDRDDFETRTGVVSDEDQPEKVEIAEYSKIKSTASTTVTPSSGSLYKVLKEKSAEDSGAFVGGKQRYEVEDREESAAKRTKTSSQAPATEDVDDFRF